MHSVAILGAGMMGTVHARVYKNEGSVERISIVEPVEERAEALSRMTGARVRKFEEVLEDESVDIVDVCTPTFSHKRLVLEALAAGKHVFCEKPVALSTEDARAMRDAAAASGKKFMVGHVVRFFQEYSDVLAMAASGGIGELVMARLYRGGSFPAHGIDNWFADIDRSGGVFVDLSIHDFDFLRVLFGPVESVEARSVMLSSRVKKNSFDHAVAILKFASGALAHVEGSWAEPAGMPVGFGTSYEFVGTKGMLTNSYERTTTVRLQTASGGKPKYSQENPQFVNPYAKEIGAFIEAIDRDGEVPVDGEQALQSLRVALAANLSAKLSRPVQLSEVK